MNIYFHIAGILCFVLGFVHSVLGELLIFKDKRSKGNLVPIKVSGDLKKGHLRIIWATWHLLSFFGWCIGALLIHIALNQSPRNAEFINFVINSTVLTMLASSLLVLIATKGKHPGWVILLLIGVLIILGS